MSIGIDRGATAGGNFERSINGVSHDSDRRDASLPQRARLVPVGDGGIGFRSRTDVLLKPLSPHERVLRHYLQPPVVDAGVVVPTRYRQLLGGVVSRLRELPEADTAPVRRALDVLEGVQEHMKYLDLQMNRLLEA